MPDSRIDNMARPVRALLANGEYPVQKQSDIRGRGVMQRQLRIEALEDRRLLAITLTPNTAIPLSPPALIMESRFRDGRTETFQFSANSGQLFSASIEIPASELEGRATLNDPNGEEQFTVPLTSIPTQFSFEATVNGVYDIRIDDHSGSPFVSGRIELIQNAQHESAGLIPPIWCSYFKKQNMKMASRTMPHGSTAIGIATENSTRKTSL